MHHLHCRVRQKLVQRGIGTRHPQRPRPFRSPRGAGAKNPRNRHPKPPQRAQMNSPDEPGADDDPDIGIEQEVGDLVAERMRARRGHEVARPQQAIRSPLDLLEDLLVAAFNDAAQKVEATVQVSLLPLRYGRHR